MIRIGTTVRLKPHLRRRSLVKGEVARVKAKIADIIGGVRLDRSLDGFTMWNIKDIERVKARRSRASSRH